MSGSTGSPWPEMLGGVEPYYLLKGASQYFMATEAQITANRRNASKSTGPKTPEGKLVVGKNAVRHGLLSSDLLPDEDPVEFDRFFDHLFQALEPVGAFEESLAERIIWLRWRLRRVPRAEAGNHIFNRYPRLRCVFFDYEDGPYRAAVEQAVAAQYLLGSPPDTAARVASTALIQAAATRAIENGYYAYAWNPSFHLSVSRYEARLERQAEKLTAQLEKRKAARERLAHGPSTPSRARSERGQMPTQLNSEIRASVDAADPDATRMDRNPADDGLDIEFVTIGVDAQPNEPSRGNENASELFIRGHKTDENRQNEDPLTEK